MKMKMKTLLVLGIATLAVTQLQAKPHGTDVLHFNIREAFTNSGTEPDATGTVTASESVAGDANNQKMDVNVSGLTPDTDYDLSANVNGVGTTDLGTFTTDSKGKAAIHLTSLGNGHGGGKNKTPLPDGFDISQVLEVDVLNGGSVIVLAADVTAPPTLKYQVKRSLTNGAGVDGVLQIKASNSKTKFSLTVSGLDASTDYQLVFNGAPVQTFTSDAKGHLKISLSSDPLPANILDLQTVDIWDSTNAEIVGTTTPLP